MFIHKIEKLMDGHSWTKRADNISPLVMDFARVDFNPNHFPASNKADKIQAWLKFKAAAETIHD